MNRRKPAYTTEAIKRIQKTARYSGAVGNKLTAVSQWAIKLGYPGLKILDFGCGLKHKQTNKLRKYDLDVTPHDFEINSSLPGSEFDIIMLSNVLNVQEKQEQVLEVLLSCKNLLAPGGYVLANYPQSPRRIKSMTKDVLEDILGGVFSHCWRLPDRNIVYKLMQLY